ncbi:hypothetical protein HK102_009254 [Quaeritorhiza haematococci]|nr:hypothetical protein HK102_009254 [Quaeritorhiza haematococci]
MTVSGGGRVESIAGVARQGNVAFDFSKIDLENMTPEELEALYEEKHNALLPKERRAFPGSMLVRIDEINLNNPVGTTMLRLAFRAQNYKTRPVAGLDGHSRETFRFRLTYHAIFFDTIKIDILESRSVLGPAFVGRVHVRLMKLPDIFGIVSGEFPIEPRQGLKRDQAPLGTLKISVKFEDEIKPGVDGYIDYFLARSASSPSLLESSGRRGSSASYASSQRTIAMQRAATTGDLTGSDFSSGSEMMSSSSSSSDSDTSSIESITPRALRNPALHRLARQDSKSSLSSNSSTLSTSSSKHFLPLVDSNCSSGSDRAVSRKKGTIISERTKLGFKEFTEVYTAFFKNGWKLSAADLTRAMSLVQKFHCQYYPNARTGDVVTDPIQLRVVGYWLNWALAAYGAVVVNFSGYGKGYIRDLLRMAPHSKCAREHLGLKKEDMLAWEYSEREVYKPRFYIARDRRTNSIVLGIRGTLNAQDVVTDLVAEYEPFLGGYCHRGFLRGARWIEEHHLPKIKAFIKQYKARAFYVTGHSLGAAIASVFSMIFAARHFEDVKKENPNFTTFHGYTYATPPSVSAELADEFQGVIDAYCYEDDLVPRLSYGNMADLREVLLEAAEISKSKMSELEKMEALERKHKELKSSPDNPKCYIAGTVYYMYKTSRVYGSKNTPPPWYDLEADDPIKKQLSSSSASSGKLSRGALEVFLDSQNGHHVIERSHRTVFSIPLIKPWVGWHHLPHKYDDTIRKSYEFVSERMVDGTLRN